jgi:hypothetical protein
MANRGIERALLRLETALILGKIVFSMADIIHPVLASECGAGHERGCQLNGLLQLQKKVEKARFCMF